MLSASVFSIRAAVAIHAALAAVAVPNRRVEA